MSNYNVKEGDLQGEFQITDEHIKIIRVLEKCLASEEYS